MKNTIGNWSSRLRKRNQKLERIAAATTKMLQEATCPNRLSRGCHLGKYSKMVSWTKVIVECGWCTARKALFEEISKSNIIACETCDAIEALTKDEGHSVVINCPNLGEGPNYAIDAAADFTDWEDKRFDGSTRLEALEAALAEKKKFDLAEKKRWESAREEGAS